MKSQFVRTVLIAGLTLIGSLSLSAQNKYADAKVPFAFQVNHTAFAAGEYRIHELNQSGLFQITNETTRQSVFVPAGIGPSKKDYDEGHLTFACHQGDCALSQIWLPGSDTGYVRSDASVNSDMQRKLGMASIVSVRLRTH